MIVFIQSATGVCGCCQTIEPSSSNDDAVGWWTRKVDQCNAALAAAQHDSVRLYSFILIFVSYQCIVVLFVTYSYEYFVYFGFEMKSCFSLPIIGLLFFYLYIFVLFEIAVSASRAD
jgi:hypothetical protein